MAPVLARLGERDVALEMIREAVRRREPFVVWLASDERYDTLRDLAGITPLALVPNVLVISPAKGIKSVKITTNTPWGVTYLWNKSYPTCPKTVTVHWDSAYHSSGKQIVECVPMGLKLAPRLAGRLVRPLGVDLSRPICFQAMRLDRWKDPHATVEAFALAKQELPELQLVVGRLAGVLNGAALGTEVVDFTTDHETPTNTGQTVVMVRPDLFRPVDEFRADMDARIRELRTSTPMEGHPPVRTPGDRAPQLAAEAREHGVAVTDATVGRLVELAGRCGIDDHPFGEDDEQ
jgi:hypothetical protein